MRRCDPAAARIRRGGLHRARWFDNRTGLVLDAESHDELDRILMAALPMAHVLEFEEIVPVRGYEAFAHDVKARWRETATA